MQALSTLIVSKVDFIEAVRAAEDYIEEYKKRFNLKFTILRFGSLYGNRADSF